jgi:hypothetical protein
MQQLQPKHGGSNGDSSIRDRHRGDGANFFGGRDRLDDADFDVVLFLRVYSGADNNDTKSGTGDGQHV